MSTTDPGQTPTPDPSAAPIPGQESSPAPTPAPPAGDTPAPAPSPEPSPSDPSPSDPSAPPAPAPSSADAPPSGETDPMAAVRELSQKLAGLEQRLAQRGTAISATDEELVQKVEQLRKDFADWPQAGGDSSYAEQPQPWNLRDHGLPVPGVNRDHLPPGEPDTLSPVVVAHNQPLLTGGSAGPAVRELAGYLATLGYPTSISQGENHAAAFDDTVTAAVQAFRRDWHVAEDPSQFSGDEATANRFVGPWTWEGLIRAATREG